MSRAHPSPKLQARKNAKREATRREHHDKYANRRDDEQLDDAAAKLAARANRGDRG